MENQPAPAEAVKKLQELLRSVDVCMLVTTDDNGRITSRPMDTIDIDDAGNIWFFTNDFSEKIHEMSRDNAVSLIYSHPGKNIYVHVNGISSIIIDREKIQELWRPVMKAWFPGGIDDPKLCLLKVTTVEALYWSSSTVKMIAFFKMMKAIASGQTYEDGETGKLTLERPKI